MASCESSCETGCETGEETGEEAVCDLSLYPLFPAIIRYKDALAQGSLEAEGTLEKVTYALEQETCVTRDEIAALATLLDVDAADPEYLLYLSATLGTMAGSQSPAVGGLDFQRWYIKNLVSFYKIKGTHPSWAKRFKLFWQVGDLSFWYRAWELWKTIPYEVGDYSRYRDYYHQLKAARFDLYYLDEDGNPVFLSPSEGRPLLPYINPVRPIHVLLRSNVTLIELEDSMTAVSDEFDLEAHEIEADVVADFTDELAVDLTCASTCEGACQGFCELTCEGAACEIACQVGCQTAIEGGVVFPGDITSFYCQGSCEGGACEGSCQVGSCQASCESCQESEKFPVHIEGSKGYNEPGGHSSGLDMWGRIWWPYPGMVFDTLNDATDVWWVTPLGATPFPSEHKELQFDKIGDGHFAYETAAGVWEDSTLIPALEDCHWTEVHCVQPDETEEVHATKADGNGILWKGDLASRPHPCTVRFEAALASHEQAIVGTAAVDTNSVEVAAAAGFSGGDVIQIRDDNNAETNRITAIVGNVLSTKFPLRFAYTAVDNGVVERVAISLKAHTTKMRTPANNLDETWIGELSGDVDLTLATAVHSDCRVNYRGTFKWGVTWKQPPPVGATITCFYVKEDDCKYYLEQIFQTVDEDTLLVSHDDDHLTFKEGDSHGEIWYWDDNNEKWLLVDGPAAPTTKDYVLAWDDTLDGGAGAPVWVEVVEFECPEET